MRVLLAEDNDDHRDLLDVIIRSGAPEAELLAVSTGEEFLRKLRAEKFDVALLDYHLSDCDADEILPLIDTVPDCPPVVVISSESNSETIITALRSGGRDFLPKSEAFDAMELLARLREALRRKRTEKRLIERQKDESLAVLAGGIAHDFNNMLVGILGKAALLEQRLAPASREVEYCGAIQRTAQRLADLARQLLAYARGGQYEPRSLRLNAAVHDTLAILQGVVSSGIQIRLELTDDVWTVRADQAQLVQCLLNLCLNAAEAMGGNGTLTIRTANVTRSDPRDGILDDTRQPGDYVHLMISDTGCGIPPELTTRIFEPYFSTKGDSRGLGLAAVHGIIRNHGGNLTVSSEVGRGSTFHIHLPRWAAEADTHPAEGNAFASDNALRVLLVEDEDEVREVAEEILVGAGHMVESAGDGEAAVTCYRENADCIDVIVLDMRLPDRSGSDVFRACREINSDTPIVVCSGYERSAVLADLLTNRQHERVGFLPKPFTPTQLLDAVAAVVSGRVLNPH